MDTDSSQVKWSEHSFCYTHTAQNSLFVMLWGHITAHGSGNLHSCIETTCIGMGLVCHTSRWLFFFCSIFNKNGKIFMFFPYNSVSSPASLSSFTSIINNFLATLVCNSVGWIGIDGLHLRRSVEDFQTFISHPGDLFISNVVSNLRHFMVGVCDMTILYREGLEDIDNLPKWGDGMDHLGHIL